MTTRLAYTTSTESHEAHQAGGQIADWWTPPPDWRGDTAPPPIGDVGAAIEELRELGYIVARGGKLGREHHGLRHVANAAWVVARGHNPEASQVVARAYADTGAWHADLTGQAGVSVQPNNALRRADANDWFVFLP